MRGHILVVEDDADLRDALLDALGMERYEVTGAGTAEEALLAVRGTPADALLLDLGLPDTAPGVLLGRLRAIQRDRPPAVVLLSGRESLSRAAEQLGTRHFLRKPASIRSICLAVHEALAGRGPRSAAP